MILSDLADFLTTGSIATKGTNLFNGDRMPDTPDELVMIRTTQGLESSRTMGNAVGTAILDMPRFQVEVRSTTFTLADTLCRNIRGALDNLSNQTINGTVYHHVEALQSEPLSIGMDDNQRHSVVLNFQVMKDR
jgi:hypothetical protein